MLTLMGVLLATVWPSMGLGHTDADQLPDKSQMSAPLQRKDSNSDIREMFARTLGKIYPIQWMELTIERDESHLPVPRFCWDFYEPGPATYVKLSEAVESFRGNAYWYLLDLKGNCIVALPYRLYPFRSDSEEQGRTAPQGSPPLSSNAQGPPSPEFISQAIADVPALCQAIEQRLGLVGEGPRWFGQSPGSTRREPQRSMHTVWLVKNIAAFDNSPGPTSEQDRTLNSGLTYEEWKALFFDVLGAEHRAYDEWLREQPDQSIPTVGPTELEGPIPGYPMLSRISGLLDDAAFEAEEVRQLRTECLSILDKTQNPLALRGLNKLIEMSLEAEKSNLGIYFLAD